MNFLPLILSKIKIIIPAIIALILGAFYFKGRSAANKKITEDSVTELSKLQASQLEAINNGELVKEKVNEVKKINNMSSSDVEYTRLLSSDPVKDLKTK